MIAIIGHTPYAHAIVRALMMHQATAGLVVVDPPGPTEVKTPFPAPAVCSGTSNLSFQIEKQNQKRSRSDFQHGWLKDR